MRYDDLAALSPVVRKEVLSGELSRRIKGLSDPSTTGVSVSVRTEDLDSVVTDEVRSYFLYVKRLMLPQFAFRLTYLAETQSMA